MCRVLGYLGPRVLLADLLTRPRNSLINQSFDAEYHELLQLGGTGLAAWEKGSTEDAVPLIYKSAHPAFYDRNLYSLSEKVHTTNLLAHVRATGYSRGVSINEDNCHPFLFDGFRLALAHNGGLPGWKGMRGDILAASRSEIVSNLTGSTDTETLYCLLMSQYEDPTRDMTPDEIIDGLRRFLERIVEIKKRHGNARQAKLKFFLADGNDLVVANMGLGFDYALDVDGSWESLRTAPKGTPERSLAGVVEPVWYLAGRGYSKQGDSYGMSEVTQEGMDTVIISSEHLTETSDHWMAVPFQHVVFFQRSEGGCAVRVEQLIA